MMPPTVPDAARPRPRPGPPGAALAPSRPRRAKGVGGLALVGLLAAIGLLLEGCEQECRGAGCAGFYTAANLNVLLSPALPDDGIGAGDPVEIDPEADAGLQLAGGDDDGYDWTLRAWPASVNADGVRSSGGVAIGFPELGEVRAWSTEDLERASSDPGVLFSDQPGDQFGAALAAVEHAGARYLMVGAPGSSADADHVQSGAVYVYADRATDFEDDHPASERVLLIEGVTPGLRLGDGLAGCGDIDGDGVAEIAASAPGDSQAANLAGAVYLASAGTITTGGRIDTDALIAVPSPEAGEGAAFGRAVLCDRALDPALSGVNLVVGAPYASTIDAAAGGKVYLWGAGAAFDPDEPLLTLAGESGAYFGASLAWAEIDDDDYPDLVVGAPGVDPELEVAGSTAPSMSGAAYVYRGVSLRTYLYAGTSVFLEIEPDARFVWEWPSLEQATADGDARLGFSVRATDIDGDLIDEILIGMPGLDAGEDAQVGALVVWKVRISQLFGPLISRHAATITGTQPFQETGARFTTADIDGDGLDDVLIQNRRKN